MFVALEEMPPWTAYYAFLYDDGTEPPPVVIVCRVDETIPGEYWLIEMQPPNLSTRVPFKLWGYHTQREFSLWVFQLAYPETPVRWRTEGAEGILDEIRIGLVQRWEAGLIPDDALECDYHLIAE